jgi:hypothetical protein
MVTQVVHMLAVVVEAQAAQAQPQMLLKQELVV